MNLEELKKMAKKIIKLEPREGFEHVSFKKRSGGLPKNLLNLPVISENEEFQYNTTANGAAYSGEIVLECRKLGILDSRGLDVYEHVNGELFVYKYTPGTPMSFDGGRICSPEMEVENV